MDKFSRKGEEDLKIYDKSEGSLLTNKEAKSGCLPPHWEGKVLGYWCALRACHWDILRELADVS